MSMSNSPGQFCWPVALANVAGQLRWPSASRVRGDPLWKKSSGTLTNSPDRSHWQGPLALGIQGSRESTLETKIGHAGQWAMRNDPGRWTYWSLARLLTSMFRCPGTPASDRRRARKNHTPAQRCPGKWTPSGRCRSTTILFGKVKTLLSQLLQ